MSGHDGNFQKNLPTEFVDLAFPKATCKSYPSAPLATHGSGIGYLKDRTNPLICGGLYGYELMSSCYKLDVMTGEYTLDRTLFHPRVYSGPGLFFTGMRSVRCTFDHRQNNSIPFGNRWIPIGKQCFKNNRIV